MRLMLLCAMAGFFAASVFFVIGSLCMGRFDLANHFALEAVQEFAIIYALKRGPNEPSTQ